MTEASTQPRKRLRQDEKIFVNHPTLYFDDGNTILSCGSTLFCVHRSLLSKHSPVFRELLQDVKQKDVKPQILHGHLHIVLSDVAEDIEALLNVIYDGLQLDVPQLTIETWPLVSSVLRMCTKYQIERPRNEIMQRIRHEWPHTLVQHDAKMDVFVRQQSRAAQYLVQNGEAVANPDYDPNAAQEDIIVNPAVVIFLLRECKLESRELLAPLFYALSRTTWQFGGPAVGYHIASLSHADLERFIVGIERLRTEHAALVTRYPDFTGGPEHERTCGLGLRTFWAVLPPCFLRSYQGIRQPIEDWRSITNAIRTDGRLMTVYKLCTDCANGVLNVMDKRREDLWNALPTYFEV